VSDHVRLTDQRHHLRAVVGRPIQFENRGQTLVGLLWDISEGGAKLQCSVPLGRGEKVELRLPFHEWSGLQGTFGVGGKVVRSRDGQAAVSFGRRLLPRDMLLLRDLVWRSQRYG
jgi:hypothetical protein